MISSIQSAGTGVRPGGLGKPVPPQTHGVTVIGWVLVCFATMPITMGFSGDGRGYVWAGLAMLTMGIAMVVVGKRLTATKRA
jgi:hypothetical protein